MASICVLGSAGFLGSHLVNALAGSGHHVVAVDREVPLARTTSEDAVEYVTADYSDASATRGPLSRCAVAIHLVSTTSPADRGPDITSDTTSNVVPTLRLLETCVDAGVERVLFASTGGAIYGPQGRERYAEDDPALPVSPYAIGKLAIERYLEHFSVEYGLRHTVFRVSNPYGPGQRLVRGQGLIPALFGSVLSGRPMTVYGDGSMTRDYVYVGDVARAVTTLASREPRHAIYNIGSGIGETVLAIVDAARAVTGRAIPVEHAAAPSSFVDRVVLDVGRFVDEFEPISTVELTDGLSETWDWAQHAYG